MGNLSSSCYYIPLYRRVVKPSRSAKLLKFAPYIGVALFLIVGSCFWNDPPDSASGDSSSEKAGSVPAVNAPLAKISQKSQPQSQTPVGTASAHPTVRGVDSRSTVETRSGGVPKPEATASGKWSCTACTMLNESAENACKICRTPKGVALSAENTAAQQAELNLLRRDAASRSSNPVQHQNSQDLGEPRPRTAGANPVRKRKPRTKKRKPRTKNPLGSWIPEEGYETMRDPTPGMSYSHVPSGCTGKGAVGTPWDPKNRHEAAYHAGLEPVVSDRSGTRAPINSPLSRPPERRIGSLPPGYKHERVQ